MRRRSAVAFSAAALLVAIAGLAAASGGSSRPSCGVSRPDGWVRLPQPPGLSAVAAVTPSPTSSRRLVATDGGPVVASTDGGCSWSTVYTPALRSSLTTDQGASSGGVQQLLVEGGPGAETVWIASEPVANPLTGTARLDVGPFEGPFTQAAGLPLVGRIRFGLGADGRHGYAVAQSVTDATDTVYATSDAGRTFTSGGTAAAGSVSSIAVDPRDPARLFVLGAAGLFRSEDGGRTLAELAGPVPSAIAVGTDGLTTFVHGQARTSRDGGRTFTSSAAPAGVVTADARGAARVVSTRFGDFGLVRGAWVGFTPDRLLALDPKLALGQDAPAVVAHTGSSVLVFPVVPGFVRTLPPAAPAPPLTAVHGVPAADRVATLTPASVTVSLGPGGHATVPYRFGAPPRPGPLDVYFLVDTTASMESALDGLRRSIQTIIDSLAGTGLDVQFGVGDFRDLDQRVSDPASGYVYRRDQQIAPPGVGLARALAGLHTANGRDTPEAQTIALTQAATGSGMPGFVAPGQEAGFRPGSTRVIVLVTDSPFHKAPPYPTMAQTVGALNGVQAKVLGIAVATNLDASDPRPDERAVARGTGTRAPAGGIDCDGDGSVDVVAGAPAVCEAHDGIGGLTNVGDPIVSLLDSVQVPGQIGVGVFGHAAVAAGRLSRQADLSKPSTLPFSVTYTCSRADAGKRFSDVITGRINATDVVTAHAEVRCLAVAPKPKPMVAAPALVLAPLAPAVVTALPPPPPPPPASLPNANPNINPNVQPNLNPAAAAERQQQVQVALAQQEAEQAAEQLDGSTELAMSARPRRDEQAAAGVLGVALAMTTMASIAVVRRSRVQPAR